MPKVRTSLGTALTLTVPAYLCAVGSRHLTGRLLGEGGAAAAASAGPPSPIAALLSYTLLLGFALLLFALVDGRPWRAFGLRKPNGPWLRFVFYALAVGTVVTFTLKLTPGKGMSEALKGVSPALLLPIIIYGSTAEEFFTRGWFQSFLEPERGHLVRVGRFRASLPVVASGVLFGAMHLTLLLRGADPWTIGFVLVFTTTVGLLAATAREFTGSLWPAILTHLAGNAGGVLGGILYVALYTARHGQPPAM